MHDAAPGWHADPWDEAAARWWDGATWTGHTAGRPATEASLFSELPTAGTVLYIAAGRLLEPSRNPLQRMQTPGGATVRADDLVSMVMGAQFWSLREQGAIWLSSYPDAKRGAPRAQVGLARAVARPAFEGAILRALTEAGREVDLRELLGPLLRLADRASELALPVDGNDLMWGPHLEGTESGLIARPTKALGTHSKVGLEPHAASAVAARADALHAEWERFIAEEDELAGVLSSDCRRAFGDQNAPDL